MVQRHAVAEHNFDQREALLAAVADISATLRAAIDEGAPEQRLKALALTPQQTLLGEALRLVSAGTTDFREVARVVGTSP